MSNLNIGDTVRIGKGKVEYVISKIVNEPNEEGTYAVEVKSTNTGKAQVIEAGRLTLLRAAETKHEDTRTREEFLTEVTPVNSDDTFDPRTDRRQSAYGLSILAAVMRKNPNAARLGVNPFKPIGSTRAKVRRVVKVKRTAMHTANAEYNALRRSVA